MDINTEITWEGPGWYAGAVSQGIDHWIKIAADDEPHDVANREARYKGLGTPRRLANSDGFDNVRLAV